MLLSYWDRKSFRCLVSDLHQEPLTDKKRCLLSPAVPVALSEINDIYTAAYSGTWSWRRKLKIALFGELSLEKAMDLSRETNTWLDSGTSLNRTHINPTWLTVPQKIGISKNYKFNRIILLPCSKNEFLPPRARSVAHVKISLPKGRKPFVGCFSNRVFSVDGTNISGSLCSFGASI
jgi:hypothetical protein